MQERLTKIHDERFRYFRNDKNLGAKLNWLRTLELGTGDYLYLVMGRDRLYSEDISNLVELLMIARQNNVKCLREGDGFYTPNKFKIYKGIDAMMLFLGLYHPTGLILDRETFLSLPERKRYFEISDIYPENYIERDMIMLGNAAVINSGVWRKYEQIINMSERKSSVESGLTSIYNTYYAPARRTKQFFEILDMVDVDLYGKFTDSELDRYFALKFDYVLWLVGYRWKELCKSKKWQEHYGQTVRKVGILELFNNILNEYSSTKNHLFEKNRYTYSRQLIMYIILAFGLFKTFIYYPFKDTAKKILTPIGVWKILKKILKKYSTA